MLRLALPRSLRPLRQKAGVLVLVAALASLLGCESGGFEDAAPNQPAGDVDAGVSRGFCFENETGACVVTSDGCDPADITGSAVERCATCEASGGAYEVCGPARTATCFDLDFGEPCQRCVTGDGAVLYDDCAARADELGDLTCESVAYDGDDATTCEVCRDANGDVVRESCRPNASRCENVLVNGRDCRECFTAEGELAYRECERPDLDPAVCEVYGGSSGVCVDCYGDDGERLSHECSRTPSTGTDAGAEAPVDSAYCDQVTDPSGRSCTRCYTAGGALVDESCDDGLASAPGRCEELVFTEQRCLVCVDQSGQESSTQCYSATDSCADPASCPPPAPCQNRYLDDGTLCRTCPTAGGSETRCMSGGALVCTTEQDFAEEAPPPEGDGEPAVTSQVCTVCVANGLEEYRACSTDGTVPPQPVCSPQTTQDGITCEVCVDPASGDEVYSSCSNSASPGEPPAPPPDTCVEEYGVPLRSESGAQLYLPDDDAADNVAAQAAIADCFFCSASGGTPSSSIPEDTGACVLQHACTTPDMSADVCGERVRVLYDPTQCAEPWGPPSPGENALVAAMAWLLEKHGVVVYALDDETVPSGFPGACESCECPRGDRYAFEVSGTDAEFLLALDVGFYLP